MRPIQFGDNADCIYVHVRKRYASSSLCGQYNNTDMQWTRVHKREKARSSCYISVVLLLAGVRHMFNYGYVNARDSYARKGFLFARGTVTWAAVRRSAIYGASRSMKDANLL